MEDVVYAASLRELKRAVRNKAGKIIVTDPKLARKLASIGGAGSPVLRKAGRMAASMVRPAVMASRGTPWIKPILYLGAGAIAVVGAVAIVAVIRDYDMTFDGTAEVPGAVKVSGRVVLVRRSPNYESDASA